MEPRRPLSPRDRDRWQGVSFYASIEAATRKVHDSPWLGDFIAEVEFPPDRNVRIEQTGRDRNHYTVWADASELLTWVVTVVPVEEVE